jgi:hypothetical protein
MRCYVKYRELGRLLFLAPKNANVGMGYWYSTQVRLSGLETMSAVERLTSVKSLCLCQEEA